MALVATNREDEPVLSGSPTRGGVTRKGQRHVRERGGGGVSSQAAYVHSGKFIIRASNLARGSYFLSTRRDVLEWNRSACLSARSCRSLRSWRPHGGARARCRGQACHTAWRGSIQPDARFRFDACVSESVRWISGPGSGPAATLPSASVSTIFYASFSQGISTGDTTSCRNSRFRSKMNPTRIMESA